MPATKIRITFVDVFVLDHGDVWGPGNWFITAKIDGTTVGDPKKEYEARNRTKISLGWSKEVDVSSKGTSDTVEASFHVRDEDLFFDDDLGTVKLLFRYPFEREVDYHFYGSAVKGTRYYIVHVKMQVVSSKSGKGPSGGAPTSRESVTTVSGTFMTPRVEICPVVPVMAKDQMPPRPNFHGLVKGGQDQAASKPTALKGSLKLNSLANPSLIPVVPAGAKDMKDRAARIAVTYLEPRDIDTSLFVWKIKSGPVAFHGATKGKKEVLAYGTSGSDPSAKAEIELRWESESGPLLATFRAWVGHVRAVPFRANIIVGTTKGATPRVKPKDVKTHIDLANVLMYQSGLLLVPDIDPGVWDGAVADPAAPGVYTVKVSDNAFTLGVNRDIPPAPMRLNFRPGVMHLCFVKSLNKGAAGVATDRPGLSGAHVELDGTPSASWLPPSGVPPDKPAAKVKMLTMAASKARSTKADKDYLTARKLPATAYDSLYGCIMPDYTKPSDPDWPQTLAHEIGHVIGLRHRGNAGNGSKATGLSNDEVNGTNGKGHPWEENVMCYGYARSQDFDLVQTMVIRRHPVTKYPHPKKASPPPPPPPPPVVDTVLKELQRLLGVPETDVWDPATEAAAKSNMVRRWGPSGPIVEWVQKRLNEKGMNSGTVDGICGPITDGAIRRYQNSKADLDADGIAGPRTMQSLAGA